MTGTQNRFLFLSISFQIFLSLFVSSFSFAAICFFKQNMSSSVTKTTLPSLSTDSVPGPNIVFLDWDDAVMTEANNKCQNHEITGATSVIASQRAFQADPRNVLDAAAGTFVERPTYDLSDRADDDTAAMRVLFDRQDKRREDFLEASSDLKAQMMESLGPALCEAAAASSPQGRLMYLSPRQLYEWVEGQFGLLTSTDVKSLVSTLTTPLTKPSYFPTHHATFVRNIRRLQRGQLRVAVGILPNDQQLFSYLYESVYALPEFMQALSLFSLNHPDIDTQTHVSLSAFLTVQMPFILAQSSAGKYAGSAQHPPPH